MKTIQNVVLSCLWLLALNTEAQSQQADSDSTAVPGINFSLEGALELFGKSASPEDFEKTLNHPGNGVNNLDLNEDGNSDYIRVVNRMENDIRIFVLQAVIAESEYQDIAVIEIEKNGNESAIIQIIGDEDIYGEEVIVEPSEEEANAWLFQPSNQHGPNVSFANRSDETGTMAGTFSGNESIPDNGVIVNVWAWPSVRFVFAPGYRVWVSPWAWHARPRWYSPWKPLGWAAYRPFHSRYRTRYVIVPQHRITRGRALYRPIRVTSVYVRNRTAASVGHYRKTTVTTRSRTVNHNNKQYTATRKTTTRTGPNGTAKRTKTTVRRRR